MDDNRNAVQKRMRKRWLLLCCLAFGGVCVWLVIRGLLPAHGPPRLPNAGHVTMPYTSDTINNGLSH